MGISIILVYLCSVQGNKTNYPKDMEKTNRNTTERAVNGLNTGKKRYSNTCKTPAKRDSFNATLVKQTAEITKVSERYVNYVISGDRENNQVMAVYMELLEGSNELKKRVMELVPFD